MARILVTDAGLGSAIAIIRSLGARGHHVIAAAASDRLCAGLFSKATAETLLYPRPQDEPEATVDALHRAALERDVDLIVPVSDDVIIPLAAARSRFDGVCALAIAPDGPLAAARDKEATLELARRLAVPVPRCVEVHSAREAREHAAEIGWPVVLKPQASRVRGETGIAALSVAYAGGFARLEERMRAYEGVCSVLLQEYYRGEGHGVELLLHEGRPLAAFQHRRLREVPVTGGASSFRESVPLDPLLYDYSVRLLGELRWTGLAMVEFKVGDAGPKLMEINGRVWGSLPLAVKAGVDFPGMLADLYLQGPPPPGSKPWTSYELGVRSRNLELEVVWIASVLRKRRRYPFLELPRRREAVRAAARLLRAPPGDGYDVISLADPRPGVVQLVRVGRKLGRKVGRAS